MITPPSTDEPLDSGLLARYFGSAPSPADREVVRVWVGDNPGRTRELELLGAVWQRAQHAPMTPPSAPAWQRLAERMTQAPNERPSAARHHGWPAAGLAASMAAAIMLWIGRGYYTSQARDITAPLGGRTAATLPDGTRLTLGPGSQLHVPAGYGTRTRQVDLDGEAYFSVMHDTRHPFSVLAKNVRITDIGTEFDVRAYDTDLRIAVAKGEVSAIRAPLPRPLPFAFGVGRGAFTNSARGGRKNAAPTNDIEILTAGDMAEATDAGFTVTHHADIASATAWLQGNLVFKDTPLREAAQELGRAYDLEIAIADSSAATQVVTGSFGHVPVDEALDELTQIVGAEYERHGRSVVIRRRRAAGVTQPENDWPTRGERLVSATPSQEPNR